MCPGRRHEDLARYGGRDMAIAFIEHRLDGSGSIALLLPDHLVAAAAGQPAGDGAVPVDLGLDLGAVWRSHHDYALRTYGPSAVPPHGVRATPPTIVSGPGRPFGGQLRAEGAVIVPSKVRDTPA